MKQIEVDDEVLAALAKHATGFNVVPNDVLRRILGLESQPQSSSQEISTLQTFLKSQEFQRNRQAVDRYLAILSWLWTAHEDELSAVILHYERGNRLYFATSQAEVINSGDGITARHIPLSPFWALVTLDNKTKRLILEEILSTLGYSKQDMELALLEIPDSNIRRSRSGLKLLEKYLDMSGSK